MAGEVEKPKRHWIPNPNPENAIPGLKGYQKTEVVAKRHAEWLKLRMRGWTYQRIADEYGVTKSSVYGAVNRALAEIKQEPAQDVRDMELARLDAMYDAVVAVLEGLHYQVTPSGRVAYLGDDPLHDPTPVLQAVDRLLRIQERRAKYLGLDAPAKQDVGISVSYEIQGVDAGDLQ